jgi:hypothetical protein
LMFNYFLTQFAAVFVVFALDLFRVIDYPLPLIAIESFHPTKFV